MQPHRIMPKLGPFRYPTKPVDAAWLGMPGLWVWFTYRRYVKYLSYRYGKDEQAAKDEWVFLKFNAGPSQMRQDHRGHLQLFIRVE